MMYMINAHFTKQENQASQAASAGDSQEKDGQGDDFNALISGFCMTPADSSKPDPTKKPPQTGGTDVTGVTGDAEARMANDRANLGSVKFNDPKNPAFGQLPEPVELTPNSQNTQLPAAAPVKSELGQKLDRIKNFKSIPPDGPKISDAKMAPQLAGEIKPLVKEIKTQANKFEETPDTTVPIKMAKNFAAMTQDKIAVVKALADLANVGGQVYLEDPTVLAGDTGVDEGYTHPDHNNIFDQRGCLLPDSSIKATDFVRAQRKLPKLISDVAGIAANETASALHGEIAQAETAVLPKAAAMLEQIKPAVIQLAAATANEGKQILRMRLHPAELGTVEIRLEKNDAGVLEAHFKTDTEGAKHFLTQGLDALRHSLQNAGWQVGRVEISTGAFSSAANGGDSSAQKDARQRDETSPGSKAKNFGPASTRSGDQTDISADRLVNLRA